MDMSVNCFHAADLDCQKDMQGTEAMLVELTTSRREL